MNGIERRPDESDADWVVRLGIWMFDQGMVRPDLQRLDLEQLIITVDGSLLGPVSSYTVDADGTGSVTRVDGVVKTGQINFWYPPTTT